MRRARQRRSTIYRSEYVRRVAIAAAISLTLVAVAALLVYAADVFLLGFAAMLLAIMLLGLARQVARRAPIEEHWALLAVGLLLVGVPVLVGWVVAPNASAEIHQLQSELPRAFASLKTRLAEFPLLHSLVDDVAPMHRLLPRGGVLGSITGLFSTTLGALVNLLIVTATGVYLATGAKLYVRGFTGLFPQSRRGHVADILHELGSALAWWLAGKLGCAPNPGSERDDRDNACYERPQGRDAEHVVHDERKRDEQQ